MQRILWPTVALAAGVLQRHSHFLLPSPAAVAEALWNNRSYLASHTLITLSEILSGMALGVALGMVLAFCMTMSPRLQRWVMPLVLTSQAIPVFALAPLLVLWFGFGMSAKVMMAVLVIFFPVTSASLTVCNGSIATISIWPAPWAPPLALSCAMFD